jgi:hypothetical protein
VSLIQEALKRQHKDAAGKGGEAAAGSSTPPPVPGSQPQAAESAATASPLKFKPSKPAEEAGQGATLSPEAALIVSLKTDDADAPNKKPFFRKPGVLVGIVAGAVVVLAVIGFVATKAVRMLMPNKDSSNEQAPPAATVTTPAKAPETNKPAKPPNSATAQSNAAATAQLKPQVPAPKPAATTPAATGQKPPSATAPLSPSIAPPPAPKPPPKPEVAMWPILVIKGVLGKGSRGNGGAIINNDIVSVGGEIEGVKLLSVNPNGTITLQFKGEKKMLRSGDITN